MINDLEPLVREANDLEQAACLTQIVKFHDNGKNLIFWSDLALGRVNAAYDCKA